MSHLASPPYNSVKIKSGWVRVSLCCAVIKTWLCEECLRKLDLDRKLLRRADAMGKVADKI